MFRSRALFCLALLPFLFLAMAKKPPAVTVRFHSETNPNDTSVFGMEVQLTNPPRTVFVAKVPDMSERDITAIYPFPAPDGTMGCAFKLDAHGRIALETMSRDKTGKVLVAVLNGRQVVNMMIDKPVTDGILTIQSGLAPADILALQKAFPTIGQPTKKKEMKGALGLLFALFTAGSVFALDLALPTGNLALLEGDGPAYYQYTDRDFEGRISRPWQGGQYGFTRTPVRTGAGVTFKQFHEGLDIQPLGRDAAGDPTDNVLSISSGRVVHISEMAGHSNYGRYVVVEHRWDGSPYYSLYAHLARIGVKVGDTVKKGQNVGRMGYTGRGIDRARAHVHFEICLLLSDAFEAWHAKTFPSEPNRHGLYNGLNLTGIDAAGLYLGVKGDPSMTVPRFLKSQTEIFRVAMPRRSLDLLKRYPWLQRGEPNGVSWEIAFTGSGVPLWVEASAHAVNGPTVTWVAPTPFPLSYATRGYITGSSANPRLTESGQRFLDLLQP